jgi:hypothetical protein
MNEKISKSSDGDGDRSISPPERHETWSRARMKKGGGFTSKACEEVVDKIVSKISKILVIDINVIDINY